MVSIFGWLGAILIGVSLGLLGSGGSILTVPVLLYLFDKAVVTLEKEGHNLKLFTFDLFWFRLFGPRFSHSAPLHAFIDATWMN